MNGKQYVGRRVSRFESYGPVRTVTGVALAVDEDNEFRAGDETGYVMQIDCPYGSQAMAEDLLAALGGRSYIGYEAENAVMDPEAELGDGATVGGIYTLLASRRLAFGAGHAARIGAPGESDLDREYGAGESLERTMQRKLAAARSYIEKTAEEIRLGVEGLEDEVAEIRQTAGNITLSVSGGLGGTASIELSNGSRGSLDLSGVRGAFAKDNSSVTITGGTVTFNSNTFAVNSTNFSVTKEGLITATAGSIAGWTISQTALYKNLSSFGGSAEGAYIGTDGIRFTDVLGTAAMSGGMVTATIVDADHVVATDIAAHGLGKGLTCWTEDGDDIWLIYGSANYFGGKQAAVVGWENPTRINGSEIFLETAPTNGSDRDVKKDIAALPDKYVGLLRQMEPALFRYKQEDADGPLHAGYIAQEMEQAIARAGMSRGEVAALFGTDGTGEMGIRYTELIPMMHLWLRQLEDRLARLEGAA